MPAKAFEKARDLRELYPDLTDEQINEVEETFGNYIRIAWRIFERLEREKPGHFDEELEPS